MTTKQGNVKNQPKPGSEKQQVKRNNDPGKKPVGKKELDMETDSDEEKENEKENIRKVQNTNRTSNPGSDQYH
jgi:hypothetical protein